MLLVSDVLCNPLYFTGSELVFWIYDINGSGALQRTSDTKSMKTKVFKNYVKYSFYRSLIISLSSRYRVLNADSDYFFWFQIAMSSRRQLVIENRSFG